MVQIYRQYIGEKIKLLTAVDLIKEIKTNLSPNKANEHNLVTEASSKWTVKKGMVEMVGISYDEIVKVFLLLGKN